MESALCYVIGFTLLVKAEWISEIIGGTGGNPQELNCSNGSWIDQVSGGIWRFEYDWYLTHFEATCTDGETLPEICGYEENVVVSSISNAYGFDSVSVLAVSNKYGYFVGGLSFYLKEELLGKFSNSEMQQTLACPENEVITGLTLRCGRIVDAIGLYCGLPKGYPTEIPTPTPSNMPKRNPTKKPTNTPTPKPTNTNTPTPIPTVTQTKMPTNAPTQIPSNTPTQMPTGQPTALPTAKPTEIPTTSPTKIPTSDPTVMPTISPSKMPTTRPTDVSTWMPTNQPTSSSCPETAEKLENIIDYFMDYLNCLKHDPNPDECNRTRNEIPILNTA